SAFGNSVNIHIAQNLPSQSENGHVKREKLKHELDLFYISRISEVKNLKHSLSILDHDFQGEITYNIYGPIEDEEYWEQCKSIISGLPKNINVTHHGSINPKDVQSTLNKHHFLFLTTQNENFGHSIVESFLSSKPVIISDRTPWLNLEEKEIGWDISMTDLKKFRSSIKQCLEMSQEEYDRWSENAFIFGNSTSKNKEALEYNRLLFSNNI
ncbi:MAG: glycosyltransferase involved in cell wall biosynthesis, partial [Saprospiraceae bacterium]